MNALRSVAAIVLLTASLVAPSIALAHPDHGPPPVAPQVSAPADDGGNGTNGLVIAAVSIGLVGLALGLGSLKYLQAQKTRAGATPPAAPKRESAPGGATPAQT